jgi:hypothetical protein
MLDTALKFLVTEVNAHLVRRTGVPDAGGMTLARVTDDNGNWTLPTNSLGLTLFQIEEERALRNPLPDRVVLGGREIALPPELKLNLTLLVSAHFTQYETALRQLAHVLAFFHARPLFTAGDSPGLPDGLDLLAMDLLNYGPEQMNQMWSCLGTKHLPSAVYRLRMVVLQDQEPVSSGAPILQVDAASGGR